ncbi:MAG TPA: type III-B CRISPR module RAMP protein Cmr1 [Kofleriaceae bacterium]|jgi:CRISPR-associated protein Cmr1|nr:type III-B CRISPR module RAMP protein Cmr1 [Kofleriaceae bacterium]
MSDPDALDAAAESSSTGDMAVEPSSAALVKAPNDLPPARARGRRGGPARATFSVSVKVVTPILGGAPVPRTIDEVDVIRPASVRGHLRFWWRALCTRPSDTAPEIFARESELWGCAADDIGGGRSDVEIRVEIEASPGLDDSKVQMHGEGAYALWPAREEKRNNLPAAPRRQSGTQFRLTVSVSQDREAEVRNVVRAWLLFGGYGSRTRRGLGSFGVIDRDWLPTKADIQSLQACFGHDILAAGDPENDTPRLGGATLHVGAPTPDASKAWTTALDWLREFRQGTPDARCKGSVGRPSISNWPEADKVRQLSAHQLTRGQRWAHTPRHNAIPAWPRAGFGLPIVGQFQDRSRVPDPKGGPRDTLRWRDLPGDHPNHGKEPEPFELTWQRTGHATPEIHDRLASALIVKALPLAGNQFVPCALWLHRSYPRNSEVVLVQRRAGERIAVEGSAALFEQLIAPNDRVRLVLLQGKVSLREAFFAWLRDSKRTTEVTL